LDDNIIFFKTLYTKVWKHPKYRNASESIKLSIDQFDYRISLFYM